MPKTKKKSYSRIPTDEAIVATDCHRHQSIGKDGVCTTTGCLIRRADSVEDYPGGCRIYKRLTNRSKMLMYGYQYSGIKKKKE